MVSLSRFALRVGCVIAVLSVHAVAAAAPLQRIDDSSLAALRLGGGAPAQTTVRRVPLPSGATVDLALERFDVFAPDAVLAVYGGDGTYKTAERPDITFFRGRIASERDSVVFISVAQGLISGFIFAGDERFHIATRRRMAGEADVVVEREGVRVDGTAGNASFTCGVDGTKWMPREIVRGARARGRSDAVLSTSTARWVLNLAVDTDFQMFRTLGSSTAVNAYIANLVAAASTIYSRDLSTEIRLVYTGVQTSSVGPFTIVPEGDGSPSSRDALVQFGAVWHAAAAPRNINRSAAVLLRANPFPDSGTFGGDAFVDQLCAPDFAAPTALVPDGWGGPYAFFNAALAGGATVPDPNANPGYAAATSPADNGFWPLLAFVHELGHVVQSDHTNCIPVDPATYGRPFVDLCYQDEDDDDDTGNGTTCYTDGPPLLPAASGLVPGEKGTIMSRCHLNSGRGTDLRFTFGKAGEASEVVVTNMKAALQAATPPLSPITAPASVPSRAEGATASVTSVPGLSYEWSITNGAITGSSTSNAITFNVNTSGTVTLTVTATNAAGCASATDSITVPIGPQALNPPTNAIATATSPTTVSITFEEPPPGGTPPSMYDVYRSSGAGYTKVASGAPGRAATDTTAAPDTSYRYVVRAVALNPDETTTESADSVPDIATTTIFTDPTLQSGITTVKAAHMHELRTAVNALRVLAGIGTVTFAETIAPGGPIRASHMTELLTRLNEARTALGLPNVGFGSTVAAGATIHGSHAAALREGVQ